MRLRIIPALFCIRSSSVLVSVALLGGASACASSELEVPLQHPAHPQAQTGTAYRTVALSSAYGLESSLLTAEGSAHHSHATELAEPPAAQVYTCPMHPEVVRSEPGKCPICEMPLVPKKDAQ